MDNMKRNDGSPSLSKKKVLKWDEETIAEHDKERGTRQKILEAPTPYRYSGESDISEAEAEEPDWDSLESKLAHEIQLRDLHGLKKDTFDENGESNSHLTPTNAESEAFKAKRASHYNEFLTLKMLRQQKHFDSDEDDENNEETTESEKLFNKLDYNADSEDDEVEDA